MNRFDSGNFYRINDFIEDVMVYISINCYNMHLSKKAKTKRQLALSFFLMLYMRRFDSRNKIYHINDFIEDVMVNNILSYF